MSQLKLEQNQMSVSEDLDSFLEKLEEFDATTDLFSQLKLWNVPAIQAYYLGKKIIFANNNKFSIVFDLPTLAEKFEQFCIKNRVIAQKILDNNPAFCSWWRGENVSEQSITDVNLLKNFEFALKHSCTFPALLKKIYKNNHKLIELIDSLEEEQFLRLLTQVIRYSEANFFEEFIKQVLAKPEKLPGLQHAYKEQQSISQIDRIESEIYQINVLQLQCLLESQGLLPAVENTDDLAVAKETVIPEHIAYEGITFDSMQIENQNASEATSSEAHEFQALPDYVGDAFEELSETTEHYETEDVPKKNPAESSSSSEKLEDAEKTRKQYKKLTESINGLMAMLDASAGYSVHDIIRHWNKHENLRRWMRGEVFDFGPDIKIDNRKCSLIERSIKIARLRSRDIFDFIWKDNDSLYEAIKHTSDADLESYLNKYIAYFQFSQLMLTKFIEHMVKYKKTHIIQKVVDQRKARPGDKYAKECRLKLENFLLELKENPKAAAPVFSVTKKTKLEVMKVLEHKKGTTDEEIITNFQGLVKSFKKSTSAPHYWDAHQKILKPWVRGQRKEQKALPSPERELWFVDTFSTFIRRTAALVKLGWVENEGLYEAISYLSKSEDPIKRERVVDLLFAATKQFNVTRCILRKSLSGECLSSYVTSNVVEAAIEKMTVFMAAKTQVGKELTEGLAFLKGLKEELKETESSSKDKSAKATKSKSVEKPKAKSLAKPTPKKVVATKAGKTAKGYEKQALQVQEAKRNKVFEEKRSGKPAGSKKRVREEAITEAPRKKVRGVPHRVYSNTTENLPVAAKVQALGSKTKTSFGQRDNFFAPTRSKEVNQPGPVKGYIPK